MAKKKKYPEGHFMGIGIAIGLMLFSGIGISLSIATDNPGLMGIGPAIGIALGAGIGQSLEEKKKKEGLIRPMTKKEKKSKERSALIGLAVLVAVGLLFLYLVFFY